MTSDALLINSGRFNECCRTKALCKNLWYDSLLEINSKIKIKLMANSMQNSCLSLNACESKGIITSGIFLHDILMVRDGEISSAETAKLHDLRKP